MCTAIECPLLPPFSNGVITYMPDMDETFALETFATYSCTAGFFLNVSNGNKVRTCMNDNRMDAIGMWSDDPPICVRKLNFMGRLV